MLDAWSPSVPVQVAWSHFAEHPLPSRRVSEVTVCAGCGVGAPGPGVPVMEVVSKQFASHDRFADPSVPVVCQACAWAFREPHWRTSPVVCSGETVTGDDWGAVRHVLSSALPHSVAVSVPVRGQKHVLPWARWGCVSTDVHTIAWDGESARVFTDVLCVLDAGVRVADVLNPDAAVVLPDAVLVGAGAVMPEWMRVRSWRGAPIVQVAARTWQRTSRERTTEVTRDE